MQGYARVKQIVKYCGVSERTLRSWLKEGLRHSRVKGTVLIRYSWVDAFIDGFAEAIPRVNRIAEEITRETMEAVKHRGAR